MFNKQYAICINTYTSFIEGSYKVTEIESHPTEPEVALSSLPKCNFLSI